MWISISLSLRKFPSHNRDHIFGIGRGLGVRRSEGQKTEPVSMSMADSDTCEDLGQCGTS